MGMILMLIFGEALALYGLIVSIVIVTVTGYQCKALSSHSFGVIDGVVRVNEVGFKRNPSSIL